MPRVAVTGGAGFIGSNLVTKLLNTGYDVSVVDDFSSGLRTNLDQSEVDIYEVSILDCTKLANALNGCEYIFHLAAVGSVPRSIKYPELAFSTNTIGTFNILEFSKKNEIPVLFTSSSSIYGANQELPKNEKMWAQPISPYAASKLAAESFVSSYSASYSIPNLVLRLFNVYGPRQRWDHDYAAVIPKWIHRVMSNQPIEVYGDGNASRDFTYVDFVTEIMIEAMQKRLRNETPINIASGTSVTLNDLIAEFQKHFVGIDVRYENERLGDVKNSRNDPSLMREVFSVPEEYSLSEGLSRTIAWNHDKRQSIK